MDRDRRGRAHACPQTPHRRTKQDAPLRRSSPGSARSESTLPNNRAITFSPTWIDRDLLRFVGHQGQRERIPRNDAGQRWPGESARASAPYGSADRSSPAVPMAPSSMARRTFVATDPAFRVLPPFEDATCCRSRAAHDAGPRRSCRAHPVRRSRHSCTRAP